MKVIEGRSIWPMPAPLVYLTVLGSATGMSMRQPRIAARIRWPLLLNRPTQAAGSMLCMHRLWSSTDGLIRPTGLQTTYNCLSSER